MDSVRQGAGRREGRRSQAGRLAGRCGRRREGAGGRPGRVEEGRDRSLEAGRTEQAG